MAIAHALFARISGTKYQKHLGKELTGVEWSGYLSKAVNERTGRRELKRGANFPSEPRQANSLEAKQAQKPEKRIVLLGE